MDVPFWTDFAKLFASQELTRAWLNKFYPTLRHRDLMRRMQVRERALLSSLNSAVVEFPP